ncbi:hypothetical protein QAD02_001353 [Eretmocerus hayati]|uniref:Uncharacterized protein n=1 Tax=Eretmocerus hayati TaxID=131215 RepID=A0ACC2NG69_9HYME|nr:hypothetical protein QAD02_001353 [Eretmocerus hayati]
MFYKGVSFLTLLLISSCTGWLEERPVLESIGGNLYVTTARDKNITLKTLGSGLININDINLLGTLWAAQNASRLVERWKEGVLDDVEESLQRLSRIVEGPNGLVRKLSSLESYDPMLNSSNHVKPTSETELRRLESKVRTIVSKLRADDCASDPCQNGGTCIDGYESFHCHCPPEWEGPVCTVDVDECTHLSGKPSGCQNGATCVNLAGTFRCDCTPGWHGFHCSTQKSACQQANDAELCGNGICVTNNSPLGYTCICNAGWDHLGQNDPSCRKDVDECTISRYPCSVNPLVTCHNVPGTFYCGVCPVGYTGDGFKCQDIDECLVNNGGCSSTPLVDCINTLGSRKCGPCPNGYQGDGITCFYVGSCNINNGGCHNLATCTEGPNMGTRCLCPVGYQGNGRGPLGCQPAENACKSNPCVHGRCSSQGPNDFTCICNRGYTGPTCDTAINSCTPNPCKNNGTCRTSATGSRYCECTASFSGPTCSTAKSTCGGVFKDPFGYVEFPVGTGNKYDHGLSCAWVIITNSSQVLNVTFTKFALESSHGRDECSHDYVQIHDGRSAGSQIRGRYCGTQLPNNGSVVSTHNAIYIWFHSDNTVNSDGFAFNWTSIPPVCGGAINQEHGSISSPGFPGKYPNNRNCQWTISVQPGKRIAMNFINFELQEQSECKKDFVEISEFNYAGIHRLGIFCNHSLPAPVTSSGSHVVVNFHSDDSKNDNGFHLSFLSIPGSPDCGGVYTSEQGEIVSPGYHTGNYHPDMNCEWEIRLPRGSLVKITWLSFDVERSRNCMFDSVQIYEGPDRESPLVGKYCGTNIPQPIIVNSSRILVRFESDNNLEDKGFIMKYEVNCGGVFTEPSGVLTSPFYPLPYPGSKDCVYIISQPPGKAIALSFESMDIEDGFTYNDLHECRFDRLEIRDGDNENSTLLKSLCGPVHNMPTVPIYSTHNYMFLEFITDSDVHNAGFKANYSTIDKECGGILKNSPGDLEISGRRWNLNTECLWTIRAPPNNVIQLTWISYPNRQSSIREECGRNFIEVIENYGSSDSKSLGKYCPLKSPPPVMTTMGNDLTLRYHFFGESADSNYHVSYIFMNDTNSCGGRYFAESGYIRSPGYPEKYPKNKNCVWIIEARNKFQVTATFNSFQLENSSNCIYDFLEVRSGSQDNSPLLGKFCGSRIEQEITSMTNQMFIKFVSDSSSQRQGFEIYWRSTKTGCGGNFKTSSGTIMSPNYPENYYHRALCTWTIKVSAGSIVRFTFVDFDLEDHAKCSFDYLEISDVSNGYPINNNRYCGSVAPPILFSKSNLVKLSFRTDSITSFRGFYLRYNTDCHNKMTGFQGVIESPNFPQNYENLSNCTWTISAPAGNRINITFSHFDVLKSSDEECTKDFIKIQEGDSDEPNTEIAKKCGSEEDVLPLKISSTQRQVFVTFMSDRFGTARGFRLEWYVHGCSKHLLKPDGQFTSPGYPNGEKDSESFIECEWLIEVSSDKSIEITFPKIENTKSRSCVSDTVGSIEIYNGRTTESPQLAHALCYSETPVTYTSTGNFMLLKYASETAYAGHGFIASYKSVGIQCGGKYTSQSGVIHSANYPKNYPHNQNCEWLMTVDQNHAINLTFVELDLERSRNCTDDYIKIFDGNSTEAKLLGKYCRNSDLAPYYVSSGNQMLVTMRTDSLVSAKGFKALFNRTCGARITVDGIQSLQSSSSLHLMELVNCSWILVAQDPSDKLMLTFSHLDIIETGDCESNHIEIYEGEGIDGPRLGQICNNHIPVPFYSTGNALTIHSTTTYGHRVGDTFDAVISTFNSACGGEYNAESGILVSPKYPASYPSSADCVWTINNAPGNRISLSFEEFDVVSSENCATDYLEIRENNGIGKLLGLFCGEETQSVTSSQSLWIKFKSAASTIGNPKGFKANFHLLFGDELTGDSGEIASPMYPRPFRKSETYSWRITVDFNFAISIQFLDFNFDSDQDYCFSSLKIYDGYNDQAPQLKELCGSRLPTEEIVSSGNTLFIEMESSMDFVGNLFHLKWIKIPRSPDVETSETHDNSTNSELIYLTEQNKTHRFTSPGYPDGYEHDLTYTWTFVSPKGTHVVLKFLTLNLEESENCITDYVAIYKGHIETSDSDENLLRKVCLSNATFINYPGTNVMTVKFVTDSYGNRTGFSAIASMECGGEIEESNGFIRFNSSVLGVKSSPYVYACEWFVKVRIGRKIAVKLLNYKINTIQSRKEENSCNSNYLMMKNGETASSPLLGQGKYCFGTKPSVQNTSSNHLYVKLFVSFATVDLKISFRELSHDCGGRFTLSAKDNPQEELSSPNYPNIPSPHTECIWTFMSTDEHRLSIHFMDRFDLASSENCEREYLEIRDGSTDSSTLLGRYCRNSPPSSIATRGNMMYVRYYTDLTEPRNGFRALVTSSDLCGGVERGSRGGVITSPNYPDTYDTKSHTCTWWIMAPNKDRGIRIQFEDMQLPIRRNCSDTDNIKILEKSSGSFNTTEIGTYCGMNKPGVIDVMTNEAMIIFQSKFSETSARKYLFRMNYTYTNDVCVGEMTGMGGSFQSTGYPRISPVRICHWTITVPLGFQVVLNVIDLDIDSDKFSRGSHVSFHHDPDSLTIIQIIQNSTQSLSVSSSSNYMSISYVSTGGHRGMKARYRAIAPPPCGGEVMDSEGEFTSPRSPLYKASSFYCEWKFEQPRENNEPSRVPMTLAFTFSGLLYKGVGTTTCLSFLNYVQIKAGDEIMAKVCGNLTQESLSVATPYRTNLVQAMNGTRGSSMNFTVKYKWHKCGGILTGPSDTIRAPKNVTYPVHCAWKVKYPLQDDTIAISFTKMDLGPCSKSYVAIRGPKYRSPSLGKFCGNVKPANVQSSSNELFIEYYALEDNRDFEMLLGTIGSPCGGVLTQTKAEVRSPGFPKNYPDNTECIWEIKAGSGNHIGFTFVERFNLETSKDCENDYVEIDEWIDDSRNSTNSWKSLGKVCGRNPPPKPFNSTTNRMRVKFVSNDKIGGEGFKGVWQKNCGGVFTVTEKAEYIVSPNFPSLYPSWSYCNYTLIAPDEQDIIVDFTSFNVEANSAFCAFDNVTINIYTGDWFRGNNTYCGKNSPGRRIAKGKMEIIFRSDNSIGRAGFKFKYMLNDCGGTVTSPRMIDPIVDDNPESYGYITCTWVVVAPLKKSVILRFEGFDIPHPIESCLINYLRIFEGNSTKTSDQKVTLCGNLTHHLPVIQSTSNIMTIYFRSDTYGFKFNKGSPYYFRAAVLFGNGPEDGCGGEINVTKSTQFRSQKSDTYEPYQDCHWIVRAPQGYKIEFTVTDIDLKNLTINNTAVSQRAACESDYVEVRDGGPYAELLGHFCGYKVPPPLLSTSNLLWIRFVSDGLNEGRGLKGVFQTVTSPCGPTDLIIANDSQVLTSPNYPRPHPSDITCRWMIHGGSGRLTKVKIRFDDFDMKNSERCEDEYLQISDVNSRAVISEGFGEDLIIGGSKSHPYNVEMASRDPQSSFKYCGSNLPHEYFSNYKDIELVYKKSGKTDQTKGFKLEYGGATCSRNYTGLQGRIVHDNVASCWMTIKVPGNRSISLYFNHFFLPGGHDCSRGYMQITDGGFDGHVIQKVCNFEIPNPVFSNGNNISIYVYNNPEKPYYTNAYDITYTSTYKGQGCGGKLYNYGGVFTSPLYPNPRRTQSECSWDVSVPRGMKVSLQFTVFDLGPKMCDTDFVTISEINADGDSEEVITYCGGETPGEFHAHTDRIQVTYSTSVNNGGTGWIAHFAAM